jgi:hypothetical protein
MVIEMVNTNLKPASPAAIVLGTIRIPVFEEVQCGRFVLIGYLVGDRLVETVWMKKAA